MTRRGRAPSSTSRPTAWLIAIGGLVVYGVLVVWLASMRAWPDLALPWWLAQVLPPIVYGGLVYVFVRGVTPQRLAIGTLGLWAVHLLVGMVTGLVVMRVEPAASVEPLAAFPPPPLPQLLWVPLLLFPLRDAISGVAQRRALSRAKGRERGATLDARTPAAPSQALGVAVASAVQPAVQAPLPAAERPIEARPRETGARPPASDNGRPTKPRVTAAEPELPAPPSAKSVADPPPPAVPMSEEALAQETSTDVVRVSFDRVAAQLPAGVFQLPTDRMGAGLLEPGHLLIPLRLVVSQLAEGQVRTSWKVVREQFPRHLLAMADDEVVRQLQDGQVILPLDELVPQLPTDIFTVSLPAVDVGALESFPAPFQPAFAEDMEEGSVPAPSVEVPIETVRDTAEPPSTTRQWVLEDPPAVDHDLPVGAAVVPAAESSETPSGPFQTEPEVATAEVVETHTAPEIHPSPAVPLTSAANSVTPADDLAPLPAALAEVEPAEFVGAQLAATNGVAAFHSAPATASTGPAAARAECPPTSDELAAAQRVAAVLASFKAFDVHVHPVDGMRLYVASPPGSDSAPVVGAARALAPLLADGRAPWPIDQMTLRGPGAALVMTPLGAAGRRGPALVAPVGVGAQLALLEVLALRAAAECAVPAMAPDGDESFVHEDRQEPDLIDTEASTRIRQIAGTLGALGLVAAAALRNPEAERDLYVFLPDGTDARMVGSFASELDSAMRRAGAAAAAVFSSAVLRCGKRRLIVRQENSDNERASILVAGGETERPGLAYRQVESVALALDAR